MSADDIISLCDMTREAVELRWPQQQRLCCCDQSLKGWSGDCAAGPGGSGGTNTTEPAGSERSVGCVTLVSDCSVTQTKVKRWATLCSNQRWDQCELGLGLYLPGADERNPVQNKIHSLKRNNEVFDLKLSHWRGKGSHSFKRPDRFWSAGR